MFVFWGTGQKLSGWEFSLKGKEGFGQFNRRKLREQRTFSPFPPQPPVNLFVFFLGRGRRLNRVFPQGKGAIPQGNGVFRGGKRVFRGGESLGSVCKFAISVDLLLSVPINQPKKDAN